MKISHRKIDFSKDKEYVLECHCRINYECDVPWARKMPYDDYRRDWFSLSGQINAFLGALSDSMKDSRTIAEILETEAGERIGYLWAPFTEDEEIDFKVAEVQDIFIEEQYRRNGIAEDLYKYSESYARKNGAKVFRAGTGCENIASVELHKKLGFYTYRYEFEKLL